MSLKSVSTRDVLIQTQAIETAAALYQDMPGLTVFVRQDDLIGAGDRGLSTISGARGALWAGL